MSPGLDGPGAALVLAGGEEGAQAEEAVGGVDEGGEARLLEAELGEEFALLLLALEVGELGLELAADDDGLGALGGGDRPARPRCGRCPTSRPASSALQT